MKKRSVKKNGEDSVKKQHEVHPDNKASDSPATEQTHDASTEDQASQEFPEEVLLTREQLTELKTQIETLSREREEYLDQLKRMQAEFDNYRKRNASLRADSLNEGVRDAAEALLPVLDNLERALVAAQNSGENGPLLEGVQMVCRQFVDSLKKLDIEEICTTETFDPNLHDAIAQGEPEEGQQPGDIQEVFQKGYQQGEKVIRHAMVRVC